MRFHRRFGFLFLLSLAIAGVGFSVAPSARADSVSDELHFVGLINQARQQAGVGPVIVLPSLVAIARSHSADMAASGSIWHSADLGSLLPPQWQSLGENVGMGTSGVGVDSLFQAFMSSPGHRDNILNGAFEYTGVGVGYAGGTMFVTQEFMQSSAIAALSTGLAVPASQPPAVAGPATIPRDDWYFAEGYTGPGFSEQLSLLNPLGGAAKATITYLLPGGRTVSQAVTVPATTRLTVDVNAAVGPNQEVSAAVHSDAPVIAERQLRFLFEDALAGETTLVGSPGLAKSFYFAEGYTGPSFSEYLTLANPQPSNVAATVTFLFPDGSTAAKALMLPAQSRTTVTVNDEVGPNQEVAVTVGASNGIMVERAMYFAYHGAVTGGHISAGMTAPAAHLSFAEGYTGPGFDEYLTMLNPGGTPAKVSLTYLLDGGQTASQAVTVGPHSRATLKVNDAVPNREVSVDLASDQPVVAERPMYFVYEGEIAGGHDIVGMTSPAHYWLFPAGDTTSGTDTYVTVGNPQDHVVLYTAVFTDDQGQTLTRNYSVAAHSRQTLNLAREAGSGRRLGAQLSASDPIMAELPTYTRFHGGSTEAGFSLP